jgi:hypothetical protein
MGKEKLQVETANKALENKHKKKNKKKEKPVEDITQSFFNPILFMIRNIRQIFN